MSLDALRRLVEAVEDRRGWDFSRVRDVVATRPWSYSEVVQRYLSPLQRVLDIGTGGGEQFIRLAMHFGSGIGIDSDPSMVAVAEENRPAKLACRVRFLAMDAAALEFPEASFDVVLDRHAPACPDEIVRVLRPGGIFITQQVGTRNHANITALFGCGAGGQYQVDPAQTVAAWAEQFEVLGCSVRARAEYDVPYYYVDAESLIFWMKALPMPEDFAIERHWRQVEHILTAFRTPRGIATNVHRELLIVQKPD